METLLAIENEPYNLLSVSNNQFNFVFGCPGREIGEVKVIEIDGEREVKIQAHDSSNVYSP